MTKNVKQVLLNIYQIHGCASKTAKFMNMLVLERSMQKKNAFKQLLKMKNFTPTTKIKFSFTLKLSIDSYK